MKVDSIRPKTVSRAVSKESGLTWLQGLQIIFGVIVSLATAIISWQTYQLTQETQETTSRLKEIEQQLAQSRFSFERTREIYDRTEKYLTAKKQDEPRGRVLVALISSMPESSLRADLLAVVTEKAQLSTIAARAARAGTGKGTSTATGTKASPSPLGHPAIVVAVNEPASAASQSGSRKQGFSGDLRIAFNDDKYTVTTVGDFAFTDSKGQKWEVPKGTVSSGAAVPRSMWSLIGGPFDSQTLFPSILLEYHSTVRRAPPDQVYEMFYEALLAKDVSPTTAKLLFVSVSSFGPRWEVAAVARSK